MNHRTLSVILVSFVLLIAWNNTYASGLPPIYYDLYIYSDFGDVIVDPDPTDGSYIEGTVVTITFTELIFPEMAYTRFVYDGVVGYGDGSYTGSDASFQVTMNSEIIEEVDWQIQYQVDFETAGISGATGSAIIVTIDGVPKTAADLPFIGWYDSGAVVSYTYSSPVSEIYVLTGMTVSRVDASGNLIIDTATGSYTVSTFATVSGLYILVTATTSSTTSTLSTTTTSAYSTVTGGPGPSTSTSASTVTTSIVSTPPISLWSRLTIWASSFDLSGGSVQRQLGGSTCLHRSLNICDFQVPNMYLIFGLAGVLFLIILYCRRKKKRRKKRRTHFR